MTNNTWNAAVYSQFLDARTRPAVDLLSAIPENSNYHLIYDLGCGPGNSTIILKKRWPSARVIGTDSSADMLDKARQLYPDLEFKQEDIQNFKIEQRADVIFTNAALQWVNNHEKLFPKIFENINSGGVFAVQMPNNFHSASHQTTVQILQNHKEWRHLLANLRYGKLEQPLYDVRWYYDLFQRMGVRKPIIWETVYYNDMEDHAAIYDWTKSTGLRPILTALNDVEKNIFKDEYIEKLKEAYPVQENNRILFPFRRLFLIASKV